LACTIIATFFGLRIIYSIEGAIWTRKDRLCVLILGIAPFLNWIALSIIIINNMKYLYSLGPIKRWLDKEVKI
jgi:hypothetical protein